MLRISALEQDAGRQKPISQKRSIPSMTENCFFFYLLSFNVLWILRINGVTWAQNLKKKVFEKETKMK